MKSTSKSSRVLDRYSMIEPLEARIAPAAATVYLPPNPIFVTATAGSSLLVKAGEVLTTGSGGSGAYLLYVAQGEVLVHTTDLSHDNAVDFNDITGLSVGNGTVLVSFVDIHGDIVTDLNPNGTLDDGGKGDILMDANITEIDMRSLTTADFTGANAANATVLVNNHLALSNYSIFGSIYAGGGLGLANNASSGLVIDNTGVNTQQNVFTGATGTNLYTPATPYVGNILVGTAASGQPFSFGASGTTSDVFGNLLTFNPASGEAGASIYNVGTAVEQQPYTIGTLQAGNGGFNAGGGNIGNVSLYGNTFGLVQLIAGNGGNGTTGKPGGSIINFAASDLIVSSVLLQSGNGGTGLTGTGGNGGQITINPAVPVGINAHLVLNYGNGGDGYTGGGTGGGTPSGAFDVTDGKLTHALNVVTTLHAIGQIGSNTPFDFNNSGYSDAVFSTSNPDQVVVAFGNNNNPLFESGLNGFTVGSNFGLNSATYLYLNAPAQVDSIVVGNFTGKINPFTHQPEEDIAVASGSTNYAGVYVYLSEYSPSTGAFEGFSSPLFTPLPSLAVEGYYYTSVPITKLLAGDFTGHGVLGLAVLAQETATVTEDVYSVLIYLNGETNATHPGGSGYFYTQYTDGLPAAWYFADNDHFNPTKSVFEVTALQTYVPTTPGSTVSNGHDVIFVAGLGANGFGILDDSSGSPVEYVYDAAFGRVDTNRSLPQSTLSLANFNVQGIAIIQDQNNTNIADFAALSQSPVGFLELFQGNGTPTGFTLTTGNASLLAGDDFDYGVPGANPVAIAAVPNQNTPQTYSDVAILDYNTGGANEIYVLNVSANLFAPTTTVAPISPTEEWVLVPYAGGRDIANIAFSVYYPHPVAAANIPGSGPTSFGFIAGNPVDSYPNYQDLSVEQPFYTDTVHGTVYNTGGGIVIVPYKVAGLFFNGGNGGSGQAGPGGDGGSFGQSLTVTGSGSAISAIGSLAIQFPTDETFEGTVQFTGGNGGNGFTHGGTGGNLIGISVTYETPGVETGVAYLYAGNGGGSLTGVGGAGGSEAQLYVITGSIFEAGTGGVGVVGGAGGAVLGNAQPGLITSSANSLTSIVDVFAGDGAPGIIGGGAGGSVNNFVNDFLPLTGGVGGSLYILAGDAGDAVAGTGGTGGSLFNDSPYNLDNNLAGPIYLLAGQGGSGLAGGAGGNITSFVNINTISNAPTIFTIVGGFAGNGTLGAGGTGGSVSGVTVSAAGNIYTTEVIAGVSTSVVNPSYNRLVAGAGGSSQGGAGGAGGSLLDLTTAATATNTQDVAAAGAGGQGLLAGGAGGNVTNVSMDAGAAPGSTAGKVLIIAGDGGNSTSVAPSLSGTPTPAQIANAVGGKNGPGGAGGSITGFFQPTSVQTHDDIIAGNGGATLAHSVFAGNASVDNSGIGGSITNVNVDGSIGNPENVPGSPVPIVSYNNIFTGIAGGYSGFAVQNTYTMQQFVDNYVLAPFVTGDFSPVNFSLVPTNPINDTVGNVGLVAGAAGRVEGATSIAPTVASTDGVDGSVSNVHAENIMSMIAGNVDQVAPIQNLTDFGVLAGGTLGAPVPSFFNPVTGVVQNSINGTPLSPVNVNYINVNGGPTSNPLEPTDGGELIDGAIVAVNLPVNVSEREF